jgi:PKHD-type hydroxylase
MKNDYLKIQFLTQENLKDIRKFLNISNEKDWQSGLNTYTGDPETKNNKELINSFLHENISRLIYSSIDNNKKFNNFCFPKKIDSVLVTRTTEEGYYNTHVDIGFNGHYSVTIFLSDPSTYEGGELCFFMNNEEFKIKLDAGYGVVYPTGIPHRVNKVTSGTRDVCVFWVKSLIKDPFIREICYELNELDLDQESSNLVKTHEDFGKVMNQTAFKVNDIFHRLIRRYADL